MSIHIVVAVEEEVVVAADTMVLSASTLREVQQHQHAAATAVTVALLALWEAEGLVYCMILLRLTGEQTKYSYLSYPMHTLCQLWRMIFVPYCNQ
jgi:hypothetical protein